MTDVNSPEEVVLAGSISKRIIIRPNTPLATAVAAIKMFDRDYVQKGHRTGQYHYRTYTAEDGSRVNVWHTKSTIIVAAMVEDTAS